MNYENVLSKLQSNDISIDDAYNELYIKKNKPGKRAHFVKIRLHVPEEGKGVNRLFKVIFAIPFPLVIATMGLRIGKRFIDKNDDIDFESFLRLVKYSKGTMINVDSEDAKIDIKII